MNIRNITQKAKHGLVVPLLTLPIFCHGQNVAETDTENLSININYMMPRRYSTQAVTDFSLSIAGDTVVSCLPYMGRSHSPSMGDTDGLNFSLPIKEKQVKKGKKGKTIITFSCNKNTVNYDFKIEVYPKGSAYIFLQPSNADAISYKGDWEER